MVRVVGICLAMAISLSAVAADSFVREENVVYKVDHGVGLVMDVFRPTENANGLAIVDTLSGAWYSGSGQVNDHTRAGLFDIMTDHGFTVFMVRPGSRTKFTAKEMVNNMLDGMRYIREHAAEYAIDPERVGIMGASAGGHLSLLTALAERAIADDAENPPVNLAALAVFFPPTDFLDWGGEAADLRRLGNILFNNGIGQQSDEQVEKVATEISPARQEIPADFPPSLIIHGDADEVVPLQQSEVMIKKLNDAGIENKFIIEAGGGHAWLTIRKDVETMAQWFLEHLDAN